MSEPKQDAPPSVADYAKVVEDNQKLAKFNLFLMQQLHPAKRGMAERMLEEVMKPHTTEEKVDFHMADIPLDAKEPDLSINGKPVPMYCDGVRIFGFFSEPELRLIAQAIRERNDKK